MFFVQNSYSYLITMLYSNQRNMPHDQDLRVSRGANIQLKSGWWASWSVSSLMVYIHDTAIWAVSERSLVDGKSSKHLCALNLDCTISRCLITRVSIRMVDYTFWMLDYLDKMVDYQDQAEVMDWWRSFTTRDDLLWLWVYWDHHR